MEIFGYIYIITNLVNGKVYIGKTESSIKERWYTHKWRAKNLDRVAHPLAIDLAINRYGSDSFKIEEIEAICGIKIDLLRAEAYYIKFYDSTNPQKGYNIDPMHWVDEDYGYIDEDEPIWQIPTESEERRKKKEKWTESLIKKRIPSKMEEFFKKDLRNLSGVQLERKYGLKNNRRSLLREIRRILNDDTPSIVS
jgi:group I intron endonuclease